MHNLSFPIIQTDERRTATGLLLSTIGWGVIICFMLLWMAIMLIIMDANAFVGFILGLGIFAVFYVTTFPRLVRIILRGRKIRAPRAWDILSNYDRSFLLLLRSFDDDDLIDPTFPLNSNRIAPIRYEECLVKALRPIGPALALGRPGESEPEMGAARLYVKNEHWQEAIKHLIERAEAVVAIVGKSEGLWWEFELALSCIPPDKLLFFFPYPVPKRIRDSYLRAMFLQHPIFGRWLRGSMVPEMEAELERRYQTFRARFGPVFPAPLPNTLGSARFVYFDSDGRPCFLDRLCENSKS